jgi:hemerythrin
MAFIDWTDEFSCGIESIDNQHRQLVEITNKFAEGLKRGKGSSQMNEILNELVGYTQEHFVFEEKMMEESGYTKFKQHQSQHRQLIQKIERFQFEFENGGKRITLEVRDFLRYWLTSHILKDDKAYVPTVKKESVPS